MPVITDDFRRRWEDRLARPMFFLSLAFLVALAGLFHRFPRHFPPGEGSLAAVLHVELVVIVCAVAALWLIFVAEAAFRFLIRDRSASLGQALGRFLWVCALPPLRLGVKSQARPEHVWLPWLGWQPVDRHLRKRLEQYFGVPMLVIAFMVLPFLGLEIFLTANIHDHPAGRLVLDIGTSIIWLAFAVEFFVMVSVADSRPSYCLYHWIDVLIVFLPTVELVTVVLPMLDALPLFRLLRLTRLLRLDQLSRLGLLYRFRGMYLRAWRAVLFLDVLSRLDRRGLERRLQRLLDVLAVKEEELGDLRKEIEQLREQIARQQKQEEIARQAPAEPPAALPDPAAAGSLDPGP